jgi:hypothetical protein
LNPLNASWSVLKASPYDTPEDLQNQGLNIPQRSTTKDEANPYLDEQRQKIEAIERKNAEARKRLMERLYSNEKDAESPVEIANIMDSPERIRELNPNAENLADGSAPPVPQNNPNPLGLSMDKLKELNEGR